MEGVIVIVGVIEGVTDIVGVTDGVMGLSHGAIWRHSVQLLYTVSSNSIFSFSPLVPPINQQYPSYITISVVVTLEGIINSV